MFYPWQDGSYGAMLPYLMPGRGCCPRNLLELHVRMHDDCCRRLCVACRVRLAQLEYKEWHGSQVFPGIGCARARVCRCTLCIQIAQGTEDSTFRNTVFTAKARKRPPLPAGGRQAGCNQAREDNTPDELSEHSAC